MIPTFIASGHDTCKGNLLPRHSDGATAIPLSFSLPSALLKASHYE
jgi:hypothetical protein